ncbi:MAG: helix-turn-helix domain-containing protein [Clostridia bacterium]|nr:helix-turn-helix domain-containing protein [Clostridia bacterium]
MTEWNIGEIIKKHRIEQHMTQDFVAEQLEVSRQAVSKWEQGISTPSTSNIIALAKLFNVPAEEFIREDISKRENDTKALSEKEERLLSKLKYLPFVLIGIAIAVVLFLVFGKSEATTMSTTTIMSIVWFVIVAVFIVIEAATTGLTSIWFAGGALCAGLVALCTDSWILQVAVFLIVSILLLISTRPLARKYINNAAEKTNIDAIIGSKAIVISKIEPFNNGEVRTDGKVWAASSERVIEVGEEVEVLEIKGVTLVVK